MPRCKRAPLWQIESNVVVISHAFRPEIWGQIFFFFSSRTWWHHAAVWHCRGHEIRSGSVNMCGLKMGSCDVGQLVLLGRVEMSASQLWNWDVLGVDGADHTCSTPQTRQKYKLLGVSAACHFIWCHRSALYTHFLKINPKIQAWRSNTISQNKCTVRSYFDFRKRIDASEGADRWSHPSVHCSHPYPSIFLGLLK